MSFQKFSKAHEGSFNSQKYIDQYLLEGRYPKIHSDMHTLIGTHHRLMQEGRSAINSIDLGSCTGLMCVWLKDVIGGEVIGIEGNKFDFDRAICRDRIIYRNWYVNPAKMEELCILIRECRITLIVARRVLSEIGYNDPVIVKMLAALLRENGVTDIFLEGRQRVKKPSVPLWNSDLEAAALQPYYRMVDRHNEVIYMQAVNNLL